MREYVVWLRENEFEFYELYKARNSAEAIRLAQEDKRFINATVFFVAKRHSVTKRHGGTV